MLITSNINAYRYSVTNGWNLFGSTTKLELNSFDNSCVDAIWKYDNSWKKYTPNSSSNTISELNIGVGFWAYANKNCLIDTELPYLTRIISTPSASSGFDTIYTINVPHNSESLTFFKEPYKSETNDNSYNLLVFNITEGSGSIKVIPQAPVLLINKTLFIKIEEILPNTPHTADIQSYTFSYLVDKSFTKIQFELGNRKHLDIELSLKENEKTKVTDKVLQTTIARTTGSIDAFEYPQKRIIMTDKAFQDILSNLNDSSNLVDTNLYYDTHVWLQYLQEPKIDFEQNNLLIYAVTQPYGNFSAKTIVQNDTYKIILERNTNYINQNNVLELYYYACIVSKKIDTITMNAYGDIFTIKNTAQ